MIPRGYDIACRYGGEEFTLILPTTPLPVTVSRADVNQSRSPVARTLTLGVASFPEHGSTAEELLRAADVALYGAKHAGSDQVVVVGPVA